MSETPMFTVIENTPEMYILQTPRFSKLLGFGVLFVFGGIFLLGALTFDSAAARLIVAGLGAVLWLVAILAVLDHRRWELDARSGTLKFTSRLRPSKNLVVSTDQILGTEVKYQKVMGESYHGRTTTQTIRTLYLVLQDGRRFVLNKAQGDEFIEGVSQRIVGRSPKLVDSKTLRSLRKRGGEPVFEGRKLSEWIRSLDTDDVMKRHKAATALCQIGEPALTALIDALSADSQNVREGAVNAIHTMLIFNKLARAGKLELIPVLARMLANSRESAHARASCASCLGVIGPDGKAAISTLRTVIASEDHNLRINSAAALPAIDPGTSRTALPVLLESLQSEKSYIRAEAIVGLGRVGSHLDEALPALAGALKDKDRTCRQKAAVALRDMGANAVKAAEALKATLDDEDMLVRMTVTEALERIQQEKDS